MNIVQFIFEGLAIAYKAIVANILRSLLTMVGVSVGILIITGLISLVNSMQSSITSNLESLGNTTIFVHNWPWKDNSQDWFKYFNRPKASFADFQRLDKYLTDVDAVCYSVTANGKTVKADGKSVEGVTVNAVTGDYDKLGTLEFEYGRYFSDIELRSGSAVGILGANIAKGLFPDKDPVGKYFRIKGTKIKVIGVREAQGSPLFGSGGEDERVIIPYKLASKVMPLKRRGVDKVIIIKASDYDRLPWVEQETIGIMRASRKLKPAAENNFSINKQELLMKQIGGVFSGLRMGGIIISLFSVIIGGIGIANIMYISVRERTKEIGIQKSLGATRSFILYQFLTESVLICVLGGLIGLGMLYLVTQGIQYAIDMNDIAMTVTISMDDAFFGIGLAVAIGLVSGLVPAWVAARVDPVIAIRHS